MTHRASLLILASAFALSLSACTAEPAEEEEELSEDVSSSTLSALIADADGLDGVSDLLRDVGMAEMFDGTAPYTVFAPTDVALEALGEDFSGEEARPALLAILREHIVPGYLTAEDIAAAIDANGGPVEMRTMGESTLTFSSDGDEIRVASTGDDNPAGVTLDTSMQGINGVVFPVDTVLKDLSPEA